ncbi:MAG: outer membrane protein assembly factor [Flavobacteriaceae bacterium]|nr:outer membrane protein assembly factor [Flavobacteriaceae bacterium]
MKHFLLLIILVSTFAVAQTRQINNIEIFGAKKTKVEFLKKIINSKENKTLDSLVLKRDIVRLIRLPSIARATFKVVHAHQNYYDISITIEENFTIIPELSIWEVANNQTAIKIGLNEFNLFGRNINIGGFYQFNGFHSYGFKYSAPQLFSNKLGLSITHQNQKSEEPVRFNNSTASYLYNDVSTEVLGLYELNFKNNIRFGINYLKEKYTQLSGDITSFFPQEVNANKLLFKSVYTYDNLRYDYQYLDGFKSVFYGQFITSLSSSQKDFLVAWNNFLYYKRIGTKGNWANRVRFGLSSNRRSPFVPFVSDNNINLRGVGILVDRASGTLVWNTEYRHTLYDKNWFAIQSNVFLDAGFWRASGSSFNQFLAIDNLQVHTGLGVRFIHKKIYNAILRIDYGVGVTPNSPKGFVFGLGQYF